MHEVRRLRSLLGALPAEPAPDWGRFWPAIARRIEDEAPRPFREAWWLPFWKPVWGHPRVATVSVAALALVLSFSFWPGRQGDIPTVWASPVMVQDVATDDPDQSVMVYSTPGHDVTVIWLFPGAD